MRGKSPLFFVDKKREFVTMLDIGEVNDMNDKEMGKLSLILVENYWMTTVFSPEGLTKIDDKLEEISKATGIPLEELREYAAELMKRLIMRFDPDQTIRQILCDEEMGGLSLILVEKYWMTTAFSPGGLKNIGNELEKISKATGIPLGELRKYAVELMKRLAMRFAKQPAREIRQMLGKGKKV